ncbi:MAG: hypothetical protein LBK66_10955 [Spirochaetaceae bacterium]|jgi:hypothetical protein|nr:hypothetical protein [Spirochaetaceae bacterium]
MKKMISIVLICIVFFSGCMTFSSAGVLNKLNNSLENAISVANVDNENSYIFGRFTGAFSHPLGIYVTNLDTSDEIYIAFVNTKGYDYGFVWGGTQDDYNKAQENIQVANISIFSVTPGNYKITSIQLNTEKRKLDDEKYNPSFNIAKGEAIYIGDWGGMETGFDIRINTIQDKYEYTKSGLVKQNSVFEGLEFKNMFSL